MLSLGVVVVVAADITGVEDMKGGIVTDDFGNDVTAVIFPDDVDVDELNIIDDDEVV